jgi:hypothetical protein
MVSAYSPVFLFITNWHSDFITDLPKLGAHCLPDSPAHSPTHRSTFGRFDISSIFRAIILSFGVFISESISIAFCTAYGTANVLPNIQTHSQTDYCTNWHPDLVSHFPKLGALCLPDSPTKSPTHSRTNWHSYFPVKYAFFRSIALSTVESGA